MSNKKVDLKDKIEGLIEKYRFFIGGGLLVLILVGSGILLWRENYSKPSLESRIANYESRISQLEEEQQISKSEFLISNQNSNDQISNIQTEQGQVAGTTTSAKNLPPLTPASTPSPTSPQAGEEKVAGKININTASVAELDSLPGIGPTYAKRIVDYRNQNGGFKNIEEVKNVKGIGDKMFEKFKDKISI